MRQLSLLMLLMVVLLGVHCVFAEDAAADDEPVPPTDAEIKKMKIKDLKKFLSDRGLSCEGCIEKAEFKEMVKKNRDVKILPSKRPRKVSTEPIEKQWKQYVLELCTELKTDEAVCKPVSKVVEGSFEMHTRKISKTLHAEKPVMARTSMSEPYILAMGKKLKALITWAAAEKVTKQDPIRSKIDNEIKMFLTAVAVKNVNPMHEILDGKDEL